MVKTATKSNLVSDYMLGGLVPIAFGQGNTVLQNVIRGSDLYCGMNDATIVNVALCGIAAVKAFSNKKMCRGDMKPSNMMFQTGNRIVVSRDFGSATAYGNTLAASSPAFGMHCGTEASLRYDLTCLAASILSLSGMNLMDIHTREDARSQSAMRTGLHFPIASLCLDDSVVDVDEIWESVK